MKGDKRTYFEIHGFGEQCLSCKEFRTGRCTAPDGWYKDADSWLCKGYLKEEPNVILGTNPIPSLTCREWEEIKVER